MRRRFSGGVFDIAPLSYVLPRDFASLERVVKNRRVCNFFFWGGGVVVLCCGVLCCLSVRTSIVMCSITRHSTLGGKFILACSVGDDDDNVLVILLGVRVVIVVIVNDVDVDENYIAER